MTDLDPALLRKAERALRHTPEFASAVVKGVPMRAWHDTAQAWARAVLDVVIAEVYDARVMNENLRRAFQRGYQQGHDDALAE